MKIKITEDTGIKHEGLPHMKKGETHDVPLALGMFFVANGWAVDIEGNHSSGTRGSLDFTDPAKWDGQPREGVRSVAPVQPMKATHKKGK